MTTPGRQFPFAFEPRYACVGRLFRITPETTTIDVDDASLHARFGPWRISTALSNIVTVSLTGPYAFLKTAGPAHLGFTDRGLTFATNSREGVRLDFAESITGMDPFGLIRHPNLTLTPADTMGLAAMLGHPLR